MLERLNKVWIDSFIIRTYALMYLRPMVDKVRVREGKKGREVKRGVVSAAVGGRSSGNISYADILKRNWGAVILSDEKEESGKEGGKAPCFQSLHEESCLLQGALTGRLKPDFLWKFHGEAIQSECSQKLKVTDMGDRLVLIQSETEKARKS